MQLYEDQHQPLADLIQSYQRRQDRTTMVGVTSFGKTTVAMAFVQWLLHNTTERVWILLDEQALVLQWWETAYRYGLTDQVNVMWSACPAKTDDGRVICKSDPARRVTITMLQTQGARRQGKNSKMRVERVLPHQGPTVALFDECHATYNYQAFNALKARFDPLLFGMTATPDSHSQAKVHFRDVWPAANWITTKSAAAMIEEGRWPPLEYVLPSLDLQAALEARFSGMKMNSHGEYAPTKQRDVFHDMAPTIIADWVRHDLHKHPTAWVCSDVKTATYVQSLLVSYGFVSELLVGATSDKNALLERFRTKRTMNVVSVGCFLKGVDVPAATVGVMMNLFGNITTFHQAVGRFVRKHDDKDAAIIFDVAGNLMLHEPPEAVNDWRDRDPHTPNRDDPASRTCAQCNHRHPGIPKPQKTLGNKLPFWVTTGMWEDGTEPGLTHAITCHSCGAPARYNQMEIEAYTDWLQTARIALAKGVLPAKFEGGKGMYLGGEYGELLTVSVLYDMGIWRMKKAIDADAEAEPDTDRSEEYAERMRAASETLDALDLRKLKVQYLPADQRAINGLSFTKLMMKHNRGPHVAALVDYLLMSYVVGGKQQALRQCRMFVNAEQVTKAEVGVATSQLMSIIMLCVISRELVANWVCHVHLVLPSNDKYAGWLRDALYTALTTADPTLESAYLKRIQSVQGQVTNQQLAA